MSDATTPSEPRPPEEVDTLQHATAVIDSLRASLAASDARCEQLRVERDQWKANHDGQVRRSRIMRERPDLPIERVAAYETWQRTEAERDALRAENERLRAALRAITFISSGPAAIDIAKRAMEKGREA